MAQWALASPLPPVPPQAFGSPSQWLLGKSATAFKVLAVAMHRNTCNSYIALKYLRFRGSAPRSAGTVISVFLWCVASRRWETYPEATVKAGRLVSEDYLLVL